MVMHAGECLGAVVDGEAHVGHTCRGKAERSVGAMGEAGVGDGKCTPRQRSCLVFYGLEWPRVLGCWLSDRVRDVGLLGQVLDDPATKAWWIERARAFDSGTIGQMSHAVVSMRLQPVCGRCCQCWVSHAEMMEVVQAARRFVPR